MRTLALAIGVLCLVASEICAHGDADWIRREGYRNSVGEFCCGERDCSRIPRGDVVRTMGGYYLTQRAEFVHEREALPSIDEDYWLCEWAGQRKCFFAPMPTN